MSMSNKSRNSPEFFVERLKLSHEIAKENNCLLSEHGDKFFISKNNNKIIASRRHFVYLKDLIKYFEYYFYAVKPRLDGDTAVVDLSEPAYHEVVGFPFGAVFFSSFPEPATTTEQYEDFAALKEGDVVFDLGAYSGLSTISFSAKVGTSGRVIAVEPDKENIFALKRNMDNFKIDNIFLIEGAVWSSVGFVEFSSEGNMGSSATQFVGNQRTNMIGSVQSYTLDAIAEMTSVGKVDFIKCDIEGGELEAFKNKAFFEKFNPRIIMESHYTPLGSTLNPCAAILGEYGYECEPMEQIGVELPLVKFWRN